MLERDVLRQQPAQRLHRRREEGVDVERRGVGDALLGQRQQLPRQLRSLRRRLGDGLEPFSAVLLGRRHLEHVGPRHDDDELVVEVVRDAARQPANRFQTLRLDGAGLDLLALPLLRGFPFGRRGRLEPRRLDARQQPRQRHEQEPRGEREENRQPGPVGDQQRVGRRRARDRQRAAGDQEAGDDEAQHRDRQQGQPRLAAQHHRRDENAGECRR